MRQKLKAIGAEIELSPGGDGYSTRIKLTINLLSFSSHKYEIGLVSSF